MKPACDMTYVKCHRPFSPIFVSKENVTIEASPEVKISNVTLANRFRLLHTGDPELHEDFSHNILYTDAEVKDYNFLVHYACTKDQLLSQMTRKYCTGNQCGSFTANSPLGFDLSQLQDKILDFDMWKKILKYTKNLGAFGGVLYLCSTVIWMARRAYTIGWLYYRKEAKISEALSLTFRLDNQVRNDYVQNSPRWSKDEQGNSAV